MSSSIPESIESPIYDVVILSQAIFLDEEANRNGDFHHQNVLTEQELIQSSLREVGLKVFKVSWDDPDFDWSSTKYVLIREIWDYSSRFTEFMEWLDVASKRSTFINSVDQVKWNIDKRYLSDLEKKGINVVASHFIERGDKSVRLGDLRRKLGWVETVLKPVVSGSARHTYRLKPEDYDEMDRKFPELLAKEGFMLQPFVKSIVTSGEVSHIVIGGKYSHSILKKVKPGDYRVQDNWGGTVESYVASDEEIDFAIEVAKACDPLPVVARIDVVIDNNDKKAVGEVELIEPELWFRECKSSSIVLAKEIRSRYF